MSSRNDQPSHVAVIKPGENTAAYTKAEEGEDNVGPRIVAIGGGHGLARTLESFLALQIFPTAIVSVADNGGSTGRLRIENDVPALGDIRRAMRTMMPDTVQSNVFEHRLANGILLNHAIGNLLLLAALEQGYSLVEAIKHTGAIYNMAGEVLPCTQESIHLFAQDHGKILRGQVAVQNRQHYGRPENVWIEPKQPLACKEAVQAIAAADFITLGPGSLYTSVVPNLLVPGIRRALITSNAPLLFITNTTSQPGETDSLLLQDHVEVIAKLLGDSKHFDVLAHQGPYLAGHGNPLGDELDHPHVRTLLLRDVAVRPDEFVGTGHSVSRLKTVLQEWMDQYTVVEDR